MPFSDLQKTQIESHLKEHSPRCPICGSMTWKYHEEAQFIGIFDLEYKVPIEGKVYPLVNIACDRCSYVLLFSAREMGLF